MGADFGLFGSTWWPEAGLEKAKLGMDLAIWVSEHPFFTRISC